MSEKVDRYGVSVKLPDAIKECVEVFVDGEPYSMMHSIGGRPLIADKLARHASLLREAEEALEKAIGTIKGLSDQQAMFNDWYEGPLAEVEATALRLREHRR